MPPYRTRPVAPTPRSTLSGSPSRRLSLVLLTWVSPHSGALFCLHLGWRAQLTSASHPSCDPNGCTHLQWVSNIEAKGPALTLNSKVYAGYRIGVHFDIRVRLVWPWLFSFLIWRSSAPPLLGLISACPWQIMHKHKHKADEGDCGLATSCSSSSDN